MFFRKAPKPSMPSAGRSAGPIDFLIVGLGNPGKKYEGTRHNAGFLVLEALAARHGVRVSKIQFKSYTARAFFGTKSVLLLMPQTFMNLSGEAVRDAMQFYKLPPERVLVVFDDVSLPVGTVRVRRKGSDGGQKGMRSIIEKTGRDDFPRIKVGVGEKPHADYDLADWVLSRFTRDESPKLLEAVKTACDAAECIVEGDIDGAMGRYSH